MNKPWYKSKTAWGGLLVGGGIMLTSAGKFLLGELPLPNALTSIMCGFGVILCAVGIRDAIEKK